MDDAATPRTTGELLRAGREARGLTVAVVSDRTKIPPRLVEAIERDEYHKLSGNLYVKSFLRTYAECVGLDAKEILAVYEGAAGGAKAEGSLGAAPVDRDPEHPSLSDPTADNQTSAVPSSPTPPSAAAAPAATPLAAETSVRRVGVPWPAIGAVLVLLGLAALLVWRLVFADQGG